MHLYAYDCQLFMLHEPCTTYVGKCICRGLHCYGLIMNLHFATYANNKEYLDAIQTSLVASFFYVSNEYIRLPSFKLVSIFIICKLGFHSFINGFEHC